MTMLRVAAALFFLTSGAAFAADLPLQPKPEDAVPAARPVPLQTTQPPLAPQKEELPSAEQKPADTLHPPPAEPAPRQDASWWQQVVRAAPNCKTFSDGCRRCDAGFHCSGLPIACQPKEFTCVDPKP